MEGLMIYRWRKPRAGMDKQNWELGEAQDALMQRWRDEGKITGWEWVAAFTGSEGAMLIIRGELPALMALSGEPEAMEQLMKLIAVADDVRFDFAVSGGTVGETWPAWKQMMGF